MVKKTEVLELSENLSNLVTYTKLMKEKLENMDAQDCKVITACYQVFEFWYYLNELLPHDVKIEEENFKNDEILTKDEYTIEILRLIKENYVKRKKPFPFKINLNLPNEFNFLHWEFIYSVA